MDTPGHTDYFVNAIKGASQVDVAVLMLDATKFVSGMEGGNTRQLISLIKGNEIKDMIICLNKMDAVDWNKDLFFSIRDQLEAYFAKERMNNITKVYIPISAYKGENLNETIKLDWYKGESFIKELSKIQRQENDSIFKPLRMTVKNTFRSNLTKKKGYCLTVKVEGGVITGSILEKLRIMPSEQSIQVKSIFREDEKIDFARAGDTVDLVIHIAKDEDFDHIAKGDIICSDIHPIPLVKKFKAKIFTHSMKHPMIPGSRYNFHIGFHGQSGLIEKIIFELNPEDESLVRKNPRILPNNSAAIVVISLDKRVCMETSENFDVYSRIQIIDEFSTAAYGKVLELME